MKFIGSGFAGHLDDASTSAPQFGRVVADVHVEFLHGIDRRVEGHRRGAHHDVVRCPS